MSTDTRPAPYAHWSPSRNDDFAAAMIASASCGCAAAMFSALANDSWSWASVVLETCSDTD